MSLPEELKRLLEAGVHFGHQAKRWNPKMKEFIFGKRKGIYIIDLEKTLLQIRKAQDFVREVVKGGGKILFVGTKKQAQNFIKETAYSLGMPYVIERWVGGTLTNFKVIKSRIETYRMLLEKREKGEFESFPKKEVVRINKELERMEKNFSGLLNLEEPPQSLFIIDPKKEALAVREANKVSIPVIALVDTDADPDNIDYPIPGNDDALRSIREIVSFIKEAIIEALNLESSSPKENLENKSEEAVT